MPIELKLEEKLSNGSWKAVGSFSNSAGQSGPAEVLVKEAGKNQLVLALDSKQHVSKIMNREVLSYTNAQPVKTQGIHKGAHVIFKEVWFKLK